MRADNTPDGVEKSTRARAAGARGSRARALAERIVGAPGWTLTSDLPLRRRTLYTTELREHCGDKLTDGPPPGKRPSGLVLEQRAHVVAVEALAAGEELKLDDEGEAGHFAAEPFDQLADGFGRAAGGEQVVGDEDAVAGARSEERRVGKECRSRWSPY